VFTFTEAQVLESITPLLWPSFRILAMFTSAPVLSQRGIPMRVKVSLAFLIAFCAGLAASDGHRGTACVQFLLFIPLLRIIDLPHRFSILQYLFL
jgi:flagellar biosynthesis protein FliR